MVSWALFLGLLGARRVELRYMGAEQFAIDLDSLHSIFMRDSEIVIDSDAVLEAGELTEVGVLILVSLGQLRRQQRGQLVHKLRRSKHGIIDCYL